MPFCATCGANVTGTFCPNCGAQAGGGAQAQAANAAPSQSGGLSANAASALAYLFIPALIFLAMEPYNRNPSVRFHAWQSILFTVAWIAFWIGITIVTSFLSFLALVLLPIEMLISLAGFCFWLFLTWKAFNGDMFEIPVIGAYAKKQAGL